MLQYQPLTWIVASMALYALATNLHWAVATEPERFGRLGRWLLAVTDEDWWADAVQIGTGFYLLGIPTLALALRVGRPSHMGLAWPSSVESLALAVLFSAVTAAVLLWSRVYLDRATGRPAAVELRKLPPPEMGQVALWALLKEAHWALFRTGTLSVGLENTTAAVFLSLALLALESWSNPRLRAEFDDVESAGRLAQSAGLAILSAVLFLTTGSTLVCLLGHVLVAGLLRSATRPPAGLAAEAHPQESDRPAVLTVPHPRGRLRPGEALSTDD